MLQLLVQYIYSKSKFASIWFPLESTPECQKQRSLREGCILAWSAASVQFSGGLTVSMTLVGRQRCELCACHEWGDVSPTNTNQPTLQLPIITQYPSFQAQDAQCHSIMPCRHTPDTDGATFVHTGTVMNRSLLAHAVHPVWVTIRVQAGEADRGCMEWCSGSSVHHLQCLQCSSSPMHHQLQQHQHQQLQCRKSHPTFLHGAAAEREGRTETTHTSGALKRIRREISDDG